MSQTDNNTQDTSLAVTLTVEQLRALVREEVEKAVNSNGNGPKSPENDSRPYLTIGEAAEMVRLAPSTIRLCIRQGKLKSRKVGRRVIIKREELERFLDAQATRTCEN